MLLLHISYSPIIAHHFPLTEQIKLKVLYQARWSGGNIAVWRARLNSFYL
jgi:hypothetical protein